MINFNLEKMIDTWWIVTAGRSHDDIEYTVEIDCEEYLGGLFRLEKLIKLYECSKREIPTTDHLMKGGYSLYEIDGHPHIEVGREPVETSYRELREALGPFLVDVFEVLDRNSTAEEKETANKYLNDTDTFLIEYE